MTGARFLDGYNATTMTLVTDGCGMTEINFQSGWRHRRVIIPSLALGAIVTCTMTFDITGSAGQRLSNYTVTYDLNDTNYSNNRESVFDTPIVN